MRNDFQFPDVLAIRIRIMSGWSMDGKGSCVMRIPNHIESRCFQLSLRGSHSVHELSHAFFVQSTLHVNPRGRPESDGMGWTTWSTKVTHGCRNNCRCGRRCQRIDAVIVVDSVPGCPNLVWMMLVENQYLKNPKKRFSKRCSVVGL